MSFKSSPEIVPSDSTVQYFIDYGGCLKRLGLPMVFLLQDGYAVAEIGVNAVNVLSGFEGDYS